MDIAAFYAKYGEQEIIKMKRQNEELAFNE